MKKKLTCFVSVIMAVTLTVFSVITAGAVSNEIDFDTTTESLYLLNLDTDTVVYSKNAEEKRYPASTTKIMTYIVVYENVKDLENTKVTIKEDLLSRLDGTDSSLSGLSEYKGKEMSVMNLLYCMMVSSGNDAALVLADYVGQGDTEKFVDMMNQKAKELGCENTNFVNPHGLHDEQHYTTAVDLAKITKYALTLKYFPEITNTAKFYLQGDEDKPLVTTNDMINEDNDKYYYEYARGIKTGTTDEAGYCLVSSAIKDGVTYLCIALDAPCYAEDGYSELDNAAMTDSKNLYEWAFDNIQMKTIVGEQTGVCETKINYVSNKDTILLTPQYSYATMLPKNLDESKIKIETQCPDVIDAPVQKGDIVGTATISYNGEELTKINLVASETLERSEFIYAMTVAKNIVTSTGFIVAAVIILILFIVYLVFVSRYSKKKKSNVEVKKHREL